MLYQLTNRFAEAEPLQRRSLHLREKVLDPQHPAVARATGNLAAILFAMDRFSEAEPLFRRAAVTMERALGPDHPDVGLAFEHLAVVAFRQGDWAGAADHWRRSTGIIRRRAERRVAVSRRDAPGEEAQRRSWELEGLIQASYRIAQNDVAARTPLTAEMFETAQWVQGSKAAASLAQMAARTASGAGPFAQVARERQDLVAEWQVKDKELIAAQSQPPAKRNANAEKALADHLAAIDTRLAEIDRRLARDYPEYAALASPAPASVAEVQADLREDEASCCSSRRRSAGTGPAKSSF